MKPDLGLEVPPAGALGRVHFVGIGGVGMAGLARIMLARGVPVSGSDAKDSATTQTLAALGATVHIGHDAAHLGDADTVVVTTAVAGRQSRARSRPAGAACSCCTGRRRWPP